MKEIVAVDVEDLKHIQRIICNIDNVIWAAGDHYIDTLYRFLCKYTPSEMKHYLDEEEFIKYSIEET